MKKFIKKNIFLSILILLILYGLEFIILVKRSNSITNGGHAIVEFNTEKKEFDYLFVGDSRVWHAIENFGNQKNLNLGSPGVGQNIINRKLEKILSLNNIENVIVEYEILFKPNSYDWYKKEHYLKYMFGEKEEFKNFSDLKGFDYLDFYIPIYRYRNFLKQFIKDLIGYSKGNTDKYGFRNSSVKCSDEGSFESLYRYNFSNYNSAIIRTLQKYEIKNVYFIDLPYLNFTPPYLSNLDGKSIFRSSNNFELCDFFDYRHLNYNRKMKFSGDLLDYLKKNSIEEE